MEKYTENDTNDIWRFHPDVIRPMATGGTENQNTQIKISRNYFWLLSN